MTTGNEIFLMGCIAIQSACVALLIWCFIRSERKRESDFRRIEKQVAELCSGLMPMVREIGSESRGI